jgi:phage gpG-like protein
MIKVDVQSAGLEADLQHAIAGLKDASPLMKKWGAFTEHKLKEGFAAQRDPMGKPWADLSPKTWRYKRSGAILRENGDLASSIMHFNVGPHSVDAGSRGVSYAIYHQTGTRKMAQRKIVGLNPAWMPKYQSLAEKYVQSITGG